MIKAASAGCVSGIGLVDLSGIEPLTSSLRKGMRFWSHGGSERHHRKKCQLLLRKITISSIHLLIDGTAPAKKAIITDNSHVAKMLRRTPWAAPDSVSSPTRMLRI